MRIEMGRKSIVFIRSDEPVERTVASQDGVLLDLSARGEILALEFHEFGPHDLTQMAEDHPDLESFMDEAQKTVEEMLREITPLRRKRNRRAVEMAEQFTHHVPA